MIDWNNDVKQQLCCCWITLWCLKRVSSSFACQKSSGQRTCSSEYKMSALCETDHHHLNNMIPHTVLAANVRSVPLLFSSWTEEWPVSFGKTCGVCSNIWRIRHTNFFVFLCSPIDAVVHLHEDDSILEVFRLDSVLLHRHVDFPEANALLCVKKFPLEHDKISVNTILFTIFVGLLEPHNFTFQASVGGGYSWILPRQRTESEKTCSSAFDNLTCRVPHVSSLWFNNNLCQIWNNYLTCSKSMNVLGGSYILLAILSKIVPRNSQLLT